MEQLNVGNSDANALAKRITEWFQSINSMASSTKLVPTNVTDVKKWYNPELQNLREAFLLQKSSGSDYKKARNRYVSAIRKAKRKYIRTSVIKSKGGVWKIMNSRKPTDWNLITKSTSLPNEQALSEAFATHFQDKVKKLKSTPDAKEIFDQLRVKFQNCPLWDIGPCTAEDVAKAIDNLKPSTSSGPDSIPNRLLKELKFEALDAITFVFNRCISEGVFPDIWKSGKIIPTPKSGARNRIENFRPVCLFSNMGKLLECVVRQQFVQHLERVFPDNIYGFRSGRGTQDAVGKVLDCVHQHRANGKQVALLSMDASCAFDLINHDVILNSLEIVGVGPLMCKFTESFLKGCTNFVQIGDSKSDEWSVETGPGQGRRNSPDYYNLATMSQPLFSFLSDFIGYADDEVDVVHGDTQGECNAKLILIVEARQVWYQKIGLALNI